LNKNIRPPLPSIKRVRKEGASPVSRIRNNRPGISEFNLQGCGESNQPVLKIQAVDTGSGSSTLEVMAAGICGRFTGFAFKGSGSSTLEAISGFAQAGAASFFFHFREIKVKIG